MEVLTSVTGQVNPSDIGHEPPLTSGLAVHIRRHDIIYSKIDERNKMHTKTIVTSVTILINAINIIFILLQSDLYILPPTPIMCAALLDHIHTCRIPHVHWCITDFELKR